MKHASFYDLDTGKLVSPVNWTREKPDWLGIYHSKDGRLTIKRVGIAKWELTIAGFESLKSAKQAAEIISESTKPRKR